MTECRSLSRGAALRILGAVSLASGFALAQAPSPGAASAQAARLDREGKGAAARELYQSAADAASTPVAKARAFRDVAMSWGFEGNCAKAVEYEQQVMDYWATQEQAQPANAFYQQGEMANEGARICIDAGELDAALSWYQKGHDLGLHEPGISGDRRALWEFRLEHARARVAARRGNRADAEKYVAAAKAALDRMTVLRPQQASFFPYLTGYVAFYLGDYRRALEDLQKAQQDPFTQCLIGQAYEKLGEKEKAIAYYRLAAASTAHNPPAAYGVPFARGKLAAL